MTERYMEDSQKVEKAKKEREEMDCYYKRQVQMCQYCVKCGTEECLHPEAVFPGIQTYSHY